MRTLIALILLLFATSAHAGGEQWYQCTGYVIVKDLGRVGKGPKETCGSKATVKRRFLPWLAAQIVDLERRLGEKLELVDIVCEPTHVACVDE